jgi:DNA helicase-2/ATP-dependent DNA helicase PcrA
MHDYDNLQAFLEHVALATSIDKEWEGEKINLMTMHGAKGLEFDVVFLPGWEEGLFPSQRSIDELGLIGLEEERRLAYVGITRARKKLFISYTANRQIHGLWQGSIPSRFISELPKEDLNENIEGNLGAAASSHRQFEFNQISNQNNNYGPGFIRAKKNKISALNHYNSSKRDNQNKIKSSFATQFKLSQRVFHQKFGMGTIISVDGDKLDIAFDKAGEKRVISSYIKLSE